MYPSRHLWEVLPSALRRWRPPPHFSWHSKRIDKPRLAQTAKSFIGVRFTRRRPIPKVALSNPTAVPVATAEPYIVPVAQHTSIAVPAFPPPQIMRQTCASSLKLVNLWYGLWTCPKALPAVFPIIILAQLQVVILPPLPVLRPASLPPSPCPHKQEQHIQYHRTCQL